MTTKTKAALHRSNDNSAKIVHFPMDKPSITDDKTKYDRGTFGAGIAMFCMFVFLSAWMWFTW
jgi:hypothetical protein